jgi:L-ribulokinase
MFGAVAAGGGAGGYETIYEAARRMARLKDDDYRPNPQHQAVYSELFADYLRLHDYFGRGENHVLKRLRRWRADVRGRTEAVHA